jgi:hypothetical protein
VISRYLERWAEPESRLAERIEGAWERALIVPLFREHVSFVDGYRAALESAQGGTLCILVVNAPADAAEPALLENAELLTDLRRELHAVPLGASPPIHRGRRGSLDAVVIDRTSPGHRLPARQGVGLARRIGHDLALALYAAGRLRSRFCFSTDADVSLPADYFAAADSAGTPDAAALLFPFWHEATGDESLDRATALYELSLRWYVLGLARAGSPYAFHSVGSTLALNAEAYAAVRGFPRRQAGEDFHLLAKLCKVERLVRLASDPIRIRARRSDRVPFGTGPGVRRLESAALVLEHPRVFDALGVWLGMLDEFAAGRDLERVELGALGPAARSELERIGALAALRSASLATPGGGLRRRLHTWFDALRTLKLLHALRDGGLPELPLPDALAAAGQDMGAGLGHGDLDALRRAWLALEQEAPAAVGPTLL